MIDLSIVIVSYNGKEFLRNCILSIQENVSKKITYEIVIVDNASIDGSAQDIINIKNKISDIKTILNKENFGFSKANNQGIKISEKSRYVLFLNPDTVIEKGTLEKMIEFIDAKKKRGAAT